MVCLQILAGHGGKAVLAPAGAVLQLLLAGGLHAGNVEEAIRYVQPDGVDVSSGVEKSDGCGKDPKKIKAFVDCVRQAQ